LPIETIQWKSPDGTQGIAEQNDCIAVLESSYLERLPSSPEQKTPPFARKNSENVIEKQ
jgi:hypothetical protein